MDTLFRILDFLSFFVFGEFKFFVCFAHLKFPLHFNFELLHVLLNFLGGCFDLGGLAFVQKVHGIALGVADGPRNGVHTFYACRIPILLAGQIVDDLLVSGLGLAEGASFFWLFRVQIIAAFLPIAHFTIFSLFLRKFVKFTGFSA